MNNKQVLLYGVLGSRNDLRSVGQIHFYKRMKFQIFTEIFHSCMTRLGNKKKRFLLTIFFDKNRFKKGKYGTT